MRIYNTKEVLLKLNSCLDEKKPFSLIRFGDGGIKLLANLFRKDLNALQIISMKEGIPLEKMVSVCELWGYYARRADFIDTPYIYFTGEFWPRIKCVTPDGDFKKISEKTLEILLMWPEIYYNAEFDNLNFCNPEINYLILISGKKNLLSILKNRKICVVTCRPSVQQILRSHNIEAYVFEIVGQYQNHYEKSFIPTIEFIKKNACDYDLFLIAAGELGRIYSGVVKENGGRALDIGFVVDFWCGDDIHPRLAYFLTRNPENPLEVLLTEEGKKYEGAI